MNRGFDESCGRLVQGGGRFSRLQQRTVQPYLRVIAVGVRGAGVDPGSGGGGCYERFADAQYADVDPAGWGADRAGVGQRTWPDWPGGWVWRLPLLALAAAGVVWAGFDPAATGLQMESGSRGSRRSALTITSEWMVWV